jgi:hypothetical protein
MYERQEIGGTVLVIQFDLNHTNRRALAEAVSDILGAPHRYCGMPTANYEVGGFTITRTGELVCDSSVESDFLEQLALRGFVGTTINNGADEMPEPDDSNSLTIDIPLKGFSDTALENLKKIVASKETLIKKALGADSLRVDVTDNKLRFPWFPLTDTNGEIDAYLRFAVALCEMAKRQKRVIAKEREIVNEKFTLRVFLIRLGFIGPDYRSARKILLRNLIGNSAWKYGRPPTQSEDAPYKNAP